MAPKNITIIYFDSRGRAEFLRLLLTVAGQPFKDVRHTPETWAKEKPNTPFGQAPVLEVDGKRYGQSIAIANYLAREFGLYGKTNLDGLKIDQVLELINDFLSVARGVFYESDEVKKAELFKNIREVESPKFLRFFENLLEESGTGFFVGNSITLADIAFYDLVYSFVKEKLLSSNGFPLVEGLVKKVESNDNIKAYLATRKETEH